MIDVTPVGSEKSSRRLGTGWGPAAIVAALACVLTLHAIVAMLAAPSKAHPFGPELERIELLFSFAPRLAVTIIAGGALGLAGTLVQQSLRNPLADPTTLGTAAGAQLALTAATLFLPGPAAAFRVEIAFAGAMAATILVVGMAARHQMSALSLLLAGQVMNLVSGACSALLALLHHDRLQSAFIWTTGQMTQYDWGTALYLAPRVAAALAAAVLLLRPLSLMSLGSEAGRSLGLAGPRIQVLTLGLAVAVSACVVSAVGLVALIGLAAPALVRLSGARSFREQLCWAPPTGGAMLWLTDQVVQSLDHLVPRLATGTATAFLGALFLLVMLTNARGVSFATLEERSGSQGAYRRARPLVLFAASGLLLAGTIVVASLVGRSSEGWQLANLSELGRVLPWRWPRILASAVAGAALGSAGCIVQRLTGNEIAGPESLGISAGAVFGVIVALLILPAPMAAAASIPAAVVGAATVFALALVLGQRAEFAPQRILLTGVAMTGALSAAIPLVLASGDPSVANLISWISGSTYRVTGQQAIMSAVVVAPAFLIAPCLLRWLDLLPLGSPLCKALGVNLTTSRFALLSLASLLTAVATLIVGPLSFIGVMAPHTAALLGCRRALPHFVGASMAGAVITTAGDWLGRTILFPYQIPAGVAATLIGAPYFMWLLQRRRSSA